MDLKQQTQSDRSYIKYIVLFKKCDYLIFCSEPTVINGVLRVLETFYHKKFLVDKLSVKWEKFHGKLFLLFSSYHEQVLSYSS